MIKINRHTKLNENDWLLIRKSKIDSGSLVNECIGVLRDYNHKTSLSGCLKRYYYNYSEFKNYLVFCWYKNGFIVLEKEEFKNNIRLGNVDENIGYVNIFKLNKKEINKFQLYVTKCKILDNLTPSDRSAQQL